MKIAIDLLHQGMIVEKTALNRIEPNKLDELLHPVFDKKPRNWESVGKGLPASPGAATGQIVFFADDAAKTDADGKKVVMVRIETSPKTWPVWLSPKVSFTARGGMTSSCRCCSSWYGEVLRIRCWCLEHRL